MWLIFTSGLFYILRVQFRLLFLIAKEGTENEVLIPELLVELVVHVGHRRRVQHCRPSDSLFILTSMHKHRARNKTLNSVKLIYRH